ncbi:hypothetical protein [Methanomethylophilus alvi]|uniref:hypothetical protein n=1 Tax=Methanomethylophilus alvi TaxID=1291540 RepID=UPI0037DC4568
MMLPLSSSPTTNTPAPTPAPRSPSPPEAAVYGLYIYAWQIGCKGSCCPMAVGWALIAPAADPTPKKKVLNPCPKCGDELTFQGGCNICKSCGWTKCE